MFKFDFDLDELEDESPIGSKPINVESNKVNGVDKDGETSASGLSRYEKISLEKLLDLLPPSISYTPLNLPFLQRSADDSTETEDDDQTSIPPHAILRRDLYDARFQVIDEDEDEDDDDETAHRNAQDEGSRSRQQDDVKGRYVDAETDLIPGMYEGGLKTWEGGVDLVQVLSEALEQRGKQDEDEVTCAGKNVLELGCGTALPTLYLLRRSLANRRRRQTASPATITKFHLQDYNLSVLSLVTLPNIILAVLPASARDDSSMNLDLTPEIIQQFTDQLEESHIELEFSFGDWTGMASELNPEYDLVLTAETIYREESVEGLIHCMRAAVPERTDGGDDVRPGSLVDAWKQGKSVTLVAAKVLYFGVGGGLSDFTSRVETLGCRVAEVKSWAQGVGRKVVQLCW